MSTEDFPCLLQVCWRLEIRRWGVSLTGTIILKSTKPTHFRWIYSNIKQHKVQNVRLGCIYYCKALLLELCKAPRSKKFP